MHFPVDCIVHVMHYHFTPKRTASTGGMKMAFALKETLASQKQGKDVWYRFWTTIGPCCTADPAERALFHSEQEAKQSKAFIHPLSFFEPVEVEPIGDFDWDKAA